MDPIDDEILSLLRESRPREFEQLLLEAGFFHNTLRLHLDSLAEKSLIVKDKQPVKGPPRH